LREKQNSRDGKDISLLEVILKQIVGRKSRSQWVLYMAKGSHNIDDGGRVHKEMICVDTVVGTSYIRASG